MSKEQSHATPEDSQAPQHAGMAAAEAELEAEFARFLAARNKAMVDMDFDYVRNQMGRPVSDEMCELTLHKARYEATGIAAEHRHVSVQWLRQRGYGRLTGTPLLPDGELPE